MMILGLSAFRHDPAAVLLRDDGVAAGIEEKKLARSGNAGVPQLAAEFCLSACGAKWSEVDFVGCASRPMYGWLRKSLFWAGHSLIAPISSAHSQADELGSLSCELRNLRSLREKTATRYPKVMCIEHHLCHAATAFYSSRFDRSLIVTLDEEGDGCCGLVALGAGTDIRVLARIRFPHSLARIYSQVTALLGFVPHREEHKVQWLSLEGEPSFKNVFLPIMRCKPGVHPRLDLTYFDIGLPGPDGFSETFYRKLQLPRSNRQKMSDDHRKAIASSVQQACTTIVQDLVAYYSKREQVRDVCLGGGLFQNTLLVADLEHASGSQVFVPPAPGNAGCALGAAYIVQHQHLKRPRREPPAHVYWGPKYSRQEIKDVLDNCKTKYSCHYTEIEKIDAAVQLLEAGKIVAWYQGPTEFGSRALGNRSLLSSPWAPYVKENLNDFIKHREWYRPFALAVPTEDCDRFFECSELPRFMTSLGWARPTTDENLRSLYLSDNRVRLHIVDRQTNPLFWRLLKRFGERAPAPMLINTSFNLFGEPLVVSPRDAVRSFYCSGIDALMMDHFLLRKHNGIGRAGSMAGSEVKRSCTAETTL